MHFRVPKATALENTERARLKLVDGSIRNITPGAALLAAAFLTAEAGTPVTMTHLLRATQLEAANREKSPSDAETRGGT